MRTPDSSCEGCALHDQVVHDPTRRDFLRVTAAALASLAAVGLLAPDALAMEPAVVRPLAPRAGDRAEEKRYPMPPGDGVSIDKEMSVIIARAEGKVYAFSLACPHQNTALRWDESDHEFRCPKHKSRYRPDGVFIEGRATRAMDRLAVRRDGAALVVDVDRLFQQDDQPNEWAAAFIAV